MLVTPAHCSFPPCRTGPAQTAILISPCPTHQGAAAKSRETEVPSLTSAPPAGSRGPPAPWHSTESQSLKRTWAWKGTGNKKLKPQEELEWDSQLLGMWLIQLLRFIFWNSELGWAVNTRCSTAPDTWMGFGYKEKSVHWREGLWLKH